MKTLTTADLARVSGGESLGQVLRAAKTATSNIPVSQVHDTTVDFIRDHPFFHQGLMNAPIGGGKHFRNVPFVGPTTSLVGHLTGNSTQVARGREITRGTWDAA